MDTVIRYSPVVFQAGMEKSEARDGFLVALSYKGEGTGPWLVDLSHRRKWDFQDKSLDATSPLGLEMPAAPGMSAPQGAFLLNRMNRTQCSIWHLGEGPVTPPTDFGFTEITDGQCLLALVGEGLLPIMEVISRLDLAAPGKTPPFLSQGPVLHIPCQVAYLGGAIILSFSRGYGQNMAEAILHAGHDHGLMPAGEEVFNRFWRSLAA